jgi:GH24 family phage-related lysozyme (muramidase)
MKSSNDCIELIKEFEGFRPEAYLDVSGIPTIGFGSTRFKGSKVFIGQKITEEEAEEQLRADVGKFEKAVDKMLKVKVSQSQFDALVSFAYNLGPNALQGSTLLKLLNVNPADCGIAAEFTKWHKVGKRPLLGLVRRRIAEADLYFS